MSTLVLIGLALVAAGFVLLALRFAPRVRQQFAAPAVQPRTVADLVRLREETDGPLSRSPAVPAGSTSTTPAAAVVPRRAAVAPATSAVPQAPPPAARTAPPSAWPAPPAPAPRPAPVPPKTASVPAGPRSEPEPTTGPLLLPLVGDDTPWRRGARMAAGLGGGQPWREPPPPAGPLRIVPSTEPPVERVARVAPAAASEPEAQAPVRLAPADEPSAPDGRGSDQEASAEQTTTPLLRAEPGAAAPIEPSTHGVVRPAEVAGERPDRGGSRAQGLAPAEPDGNAGERGPIGSAAAPPVRTDPVRAEPGGPRSAPVLPDRESPDAEPGGAGPGLAAGSPTFAGAGDAGSEGASAPDEMPVTGPRDVAGPVAAPQPAGAGVSDAVASVPAEVPVPRDLAASGQARESADVGDAGFEVASVPVAGRREVASGEPTDADAAAVHAEVAAPDGWDEVEPEDVPAGAVPDRFAEERAAAAESPGGRRSRQTPDEVAAEQAAADLALLRTFGFADPGLRPDSAPVVAMERPEALEPPATVGDAQAVRFRVLGRDGTVVGGATVTLLDDRGGDVAAGIADGHGRGVVLAPTPGSYVLVSTAAGYQPGAAAITVADSAREADVLLARSASVSGFVHGEDGPIAGARVTLVQDGEAVDAVDTDADGAYRILDIGAGEYGLSVAAAGCVPVASLLDVAEEADVRRDVELAPASPVADDDLVGDDAMSGLR